MKWESHKYRNIKDMSLGGAQFVCECALHCINERNLFTFVLAGGATPRLLYSTLSENPLKQSLPWDRMHLFWGDERCVPKDHPDSNYKMAFDTMISKVEIPPHNIHPIPVELGCPKEAATAYGRDLAQFFNLNQYNNNKPSGRLESRDLPSFDFILLGIGPDGHTASLFPGHPALEESSRITTAIDGTYGKPAVPRVTLTLPVINQAKTVLFLVSGRKKQSVVESILTNVEKASKHFPAARVKPRERLLLFHDLDILS